MKIPSIRTAAFVMILGAMSISSSLANSVYVRVGNQAPPPNRYQKQWQQPSKTAVWIPGHNEWRNGRYVWTSGYYTYPPKRNDRYVAPRYQHTPNGYYYRPGYWNN